MYHESRNEGFNNRAPSNYGEGERVDLLSCIVCNRIAHRGCRVDAHIELLGTAQISAEERLGNRTILLEKRICTECVQSHFNTQVGQRTHTIALGAAYDYLPLATSNWSGTRYHVGMHRIPVHVANFHSVLAPTPSVTNIIKFKTNVSLIFCHSTPHFISTKPSQPLV